MKHNYSYGKKSDVEDCMFINKTHLELKGNESRDGGGIKPWRDAQCEDSSIYITVKLGSHRGHQ